VLGIVVSDSRPVQIPRDSQPIKIIQPTPPQAQFLPEMQSTGAPVMAAPVTVGQHPTLVMEERRPFRLDPQTIVAELPFKPITKPFADFPPAPAQSAAPAQPAPAAPTEFHGQPQPTLSTAAPAPSIAAPNMTPWQPNEYAQPATPAPGQFQPAEPLPVAQPVAAPAPSQPVQVVADTGPLASPLAPVGFQQQAIPAYYSPQTAYIAQPVMAAMPMQDTRPSQPVFVTAAPSPAQPMPMIHSNATMGMPAYAMPGYTMSPMHANATMAMPTPAYPPGVIAGQPPHPSEPVPVIHAATTMGMPFYGQPQFQLSMAAAGPTMAGQPEMDYRLANAMHSESRPQKLQGKEEDDEDKEEVNILAVVIFGSLSVTALGGLGMLILLMFAT
jgi:hypothetical protein